MQVISLIILEFLTQILDLRDVLLDYIFVKHLGKPTESVLFKGGLVWSTASKFTAMHYVRLAASRVLLLGYIKVADINTV